MSTSIIKPQKRMRLASGAVLIPNSGYEAWHTQASAMPGLNDVERRVLDAIREWSRRLYVERFEGSLSFERMARRLDTDPVNVRWAVNRLVELGLVAVKPGAGGRANTYLPCLPKRVVAAMEAAVGENEPAPPF
jgi:predicted transcriptional regulator